jgi:hypothetical protein
LRSSDRGGKNSRLQQILDWLGTDFDGVIFSIGNSFACLAQSALEVKDLVKGAERKKQENKNDPDRQSDSYTKRGHSTEPLRLRINPALFEFHQDLGRITSPGWHLSLTTM